MLQRKHPHDEVALEIEISLRSHDQDVGMCMCAFAVRGVLGGSSVHGC